MDDVVVALEFQGLKNLNREAPYKSDRNANKVVWLDKLIKIHAQQFKWDEQMSPEYLVVNYSNDIVIIVLVAVLQIFKYPKLHARLILEPLLVSNDFDRDQLLLFVVKALQSLTKTATAELVHNFVPES